MFRSMSLAAAVAVIGCGGPSKTAPAPASFAPAAVADEVVVRVGDYEITSHDLLARARAVRAAGGQPRADEVLDTLIDEATLAVDGKRTGLDREPVVVAAVAAARASAAAKLLREQVAASATVSDDTIAEAFHSIADSVHLEGVIAGSESQAREVYDRLAAGADLAEEAKSSLDPSSAGKGGDFGTQTRGQLEPALATAVFAAPIGELVEPVKLVNGWAVVRVVERTIGTDEELAARRKAISEFIADRLGRELQHHYAEQLRKQAGVAVDEEFLTGTGTRLAASEEELAHPIAVIDGEPLTYREVLAETQSLARGRENPHASGPTIKISLAWQLVDARLLQREALAQGLGEAPQAEAAARRAERDAMIRLAIARAQAEAAPPTDSEIEAYYAANPSEFQRAARKHCAHIMVADKSLADQLRTRIRGGESFAELAKRYSADPSTASQGGTLGALTDDQIDRLAAGGEPDLARAIRTTKPGDVSEPVRSSAGWHLIYVEDAVPARLAPLRDVRDAIANVLRARHAHEAVRMRATELRANVPVKVDRAALDRVAPYLGPTESAHPTGSNPS